MPSYVLNVEGFKSIIGELDAEADIPLYYRQPHDIELMEHQEDRRFMGPGIWKPGNSRDRAATQPIPEVYRVFPDQTTPLHDWAILMWREMNAWMTDDQFVDLLSNTWALTNGTGWPGRRNIIYGVDLTNGFPNFHAPLIFGGMLFKGQVIAGNLHIENLRHNVPVTASYVLERPWLWGYATAVTSTGRVNMISKKNRATGIMTPMKIPFITKETVNLPLSYLHRLEPGYVPNIPHKNVNKYSLSNGLVEGSLL